MRRSISLAGLAPTDLPLIFFLLSAVLALVPAYDRSLAWPSLLALLAGGLGYGLISRMGGMWPLRLARGATLAAGLAGLVLIVQYTHAPGLGEAGLISRLAGWIGRFSPSLSAWTPQANGVATALEGMAFLALAVWRLEEKVGWRWVWAAVLLILALGLLLSESRGAWLALGLAGLVWLALYFRRARWLIGLMGLGGLALLLIVLVAGDAHILERIPLVDRTLAPLFIRPDRLDVYQGGIYLVQDMPFSGIGLGGQFAMVYSRFVLLIQVPFLTYSHNFYLETWLELGLAGFLALIWLLGGVFWPALAAAGSKHDLLYEGAWVGLLVMSLHGLTDARPFVDLWCWLPFFLLLGLSASLWLHRPARAPRGWLFNGPLALAGVALLAAAILVPLTPASWQANLGSLQHTHAELDPQLDDQQRNARLDSAVRLYQQSIASQAAQRTAHLRLGLIYTQRMQFAEAVDQLEAAYAFDPTNLTARKALGLAYAWTGSLEQAREMLQADPSITEELNTWGWWWGQQGQTTLAGYAYQVSLLLDPAQPVVQQELDDLPAP